MAIPFLRTLLVVLLAAAAPALQASDVYSEPDAPLVARVFDDTIRIRRSAEARQAILVRLLERYAAGKGIVAEPAEIDAYADMLRQILQADRARWASRLEEIDKRLALRSLTETERKGLAAEREALRALLRSDAAETASTRTLEDKYFIRPLSAGFVKQWKVDRALYQQYGGRIAVELGTPEPVDAYLRFLEESRDRGDFQLLAPELEREFWWPFRTDAMHTFLVPGSPEEARTYATPPWQNNAVAPAR